MVACVKDKILKGGGIWEKERTANTFVRVVVAAARFLIFFFFVYFLVIGFIFSFKMCGRGGVHAKAPGVEYTEEKHFFRFRYILNRTCRSVILASKASIYQPLHSLRLLFIKKKKQSLSCPTSASGITVVPPWDSA